MSKVNAVPFWLTHPMNVLLRRTSGYAQPAGPQAGLSSDFWASDLAGKELRQLTGAVSSTIVGINTGGAGPVPTNAKVNDLWTPQKNVVPLMTSYKADDSRWTPTANIVFVGSGVTPEELWETCGLTPNQVYYNVGRYGCSWGFDIDHDYLAGMLSYNVSTNTSSFGWYWSGTYSAGGRQRNLSCIMPSSWGGSLWTRPSSKQVVTPAFWFGDGGSQGGNNATCTVWPS